MLVLVIAFCAVISTFIDGDLKKGPNGSLVMECSPERVYPQRVSLESAPLLLVKTFTIMRSATFYTSAEIA